VDDSIARPPTGEFKIPTSKLLENDIDPDGHPLSVTSAGPTSVNNASVTPYEIVDADAAGANARFYWAIVP
jgi:hypothetical protein